MYHNDHEIVLLYDNDMCKSSRLSHPNLDHAIMSDLPISVCEISQSVICVPRPANPVLTLMLLVANLAKTKWWPNPGTWVLIWENSLRTIQWVPIQHDLDGFQNPLCPSSLDKSSFSIRRVKSKEDWVYINHTLLTVITLHVWFTVIVARPFPGSSVTVTVLAIKQ